MNLILSDLIHLYKVVPYRKGGLLLNNVFAFIAAALMGFSKVVGTYWLLILGRFVIGFNAG